MERRSHRLDASGRPVCLVRKAGEQMVALRHRGGAVFSFGDVAWDHDPAQTESQR